MADVARLRGIEVDLSANSLRLRLDDEATAPAPARPVRATIDVGAGGRLVGIELPFGYIDVMEPEAGTEYLTRSADAEAIVEWGGGVPVAVTIPRRGAGYEITYPSGNQ